MGADTLRIQHQPPSASPTSSGSAMITTSPKSLLTETTSGTPTKRRNNWSSAYDNLPSNNSSTSTRSTGVKPSERVQLVSNPMDLLSSHQVDQWSDDSAYSWHDHTYQSIHQQSTPAKQHQPPPYHHPHHHTATNLQQTQAYQDPAGMDVYENHLTAAGETAAGDSQALGSLDVMLPNGQMVAATLMRNPNSGKIVPVVQVPQGPGGTTPAQTPRTVSRSQQSQPQASSSNTTSSTSTTSVSPPPSQAQNPHHMMDHVTFPKTIVYKNDPVQVPTSVGPTTTGHLRQKPPAMPRQQHGFQGGGFTNPHGRGNQVIQHNSPSKRGGYLVWNLLTVEFTPRFINDPYHSIDHVHFSPTIIYKSDLVQLPDKYVRNLLLESGEQSV